jgi:hypothetical protein
LLHWFRYKRIKEKTMSSSDPGRLPAAPKTVRTIYVSTLSSAMCIAFAVAPALAQSPPVPAQPPGAPKNAQPPSESTTPPALPGDPAKPDKPLSDELKQNDGVLETPKALDNEIVREAPVPEPNTTPVIPPPGSPGGDPNVKPK